MSALAAKAGLSPQMVSALENGTRKNPTAETLIALASVLDIQITYLKEDRPFPVTADSAVFFRSSASSRNRRHQEMRKQQANWAYEITAWLDQHVTLPEFDSAKFWPESSSITEHSEESIEEAAFNLRSAWSMGLGPIPNMVALLESKGIRVIRQPSGASKLDAFSRIVNAQPMIFLASDKSSGTRSRFDAAHELGHLLLHPHLTSEEISNPETLKRIEGEANHFAGAFLLPEPSYSREIHGVTLGSFLAMKLRWKVSAQALIRRALDLGAIDGFQYSRLCVDISSRGMRKKEPHDESIVPEMPTVHSRGWKLLTDSGTVTRHQIVDELQLPPDVIVATLSIDRSSFATDNVVNLDFRRTNSN